MPRRRFPLAGRLKIEGWSGTAEWPQIERQIGVPTRPLGTWEYLNFCTGACECEIECAPSGHRVYAQQQFSFVFLAALARVARSPPGVCYQAASNTNDVARCEEYATSCEAPRNTHDDRHTRALARGWRPQEAEERSCRVPRHNLVVVVAGDRGQAGGVGEPFVKETHLQPNVSAFLRPLLDVPHRPTDN